MKGFAVAGVVGSLAVVTAAVVGRDRWHAAQANIRRYSMPGARSYDLVARLLFRSRYEAIAEAIAVGVPAGSRLLDVGCGPGEVLVRLATLAPGIDATGLDVDAAMIDRARRKADHAGRARGAGPRFVVADVAAMPFPDASFDVVVSSYAVHHWPDRHAGLAEVMRVLKPGGRAIVWDVAPPHPTAGGAGSAQVHGHDPNQTAARHGSGEAPVPSLLATLRMLLLFRRLPAERYDFTKPAA
jgi:ubiquinone/menaquinone biosynthesis C-methylase UbiE